MDIQLYTPKFYGACMGLFESNVPVYFGVSEKAEFSRYLRGDTDDYYVLLDEGQVRACGGYYVDTKRGQAGLVWGMVSGGFHKLGYGTKLLAFRLQRLQAEHSGVPLSLGTSQHTYKFYERFGFEVEGVVPDGYGVGLDHYDMRLKAPDPAWVDSDPAASKPELSHWYIAGIIWFEPVRVNES